MEPCFDPNCDPSFLIRKKRNSTAITVLIPSQPENNDDDDELPFFSIILPIVLVVGVFVVVGLGLVVHRLILRYLRKRWSSRGSSGATNSSGMQRGYYARRSGVNTISGHVTDLPTYRQVIQTIQREEMPPSYYEIGGFCGVTNPGFTVEEHIEIVNENTLQIREYPSNEQHTSSEDREQINSSHVLRKSLPLCDSESMASYCYKHRLPPVTVPEVKTKQNIDDVIDSIFVPSMLHDIEPENNNNASKNKRKSFKAKRTRNSIRTKPSETSTPSGRNVTVIIRSTPL